jgi:hypothetical protein
VETQLRIKPLQCSQTQDIHCLENKVSYKEIALTYPYTVVVPWSLTCNPTWMPHNQVTYLKGSSMESFTLGPTPKIDFNFNTQRQWLESERISTTTPKIYSLSSTKFNIEFLRNICLGASIYRLQKTKTEYDTIFLGGVQTIAEGVRTDNCTTDFPNSLDFLSWIGPRLDGVALASRWLNFFCTTCLIKDSVRKGTLHRLDGCSCLPISVFWKEIF